MPYWAQAGLSSPLQFAIFISELSNYLDTNGAKGCQLMPDTTEINALYYADDIVVMADTIGGLNKHIKSIQDFCKNWGMKVNMSKTQIMVFRKGGPISRYEKWTYNDHPLDIVSEYKYLGLTRASPDPFHWGGVKVINCRQSHLCRH